MEFSKPEICGFTIYCKSGCPNCLKVKKLLHDKNIKPIIVDCDEYLIEEKENFLIFIKNYVNKTNKTNETNKNSLQFPIVFNDSFFIGGYSETIDYFNKNINFDEEF